MTLTHGYLTIKANEDLTSYLLALSLDFFLTTKQLKWLSFIRPLVKQTK